MQIKKHIPNFFTMLNIICGFIAIIFACQENFLLTFYFIIAASFFDFVDGGVARLLHVQSEIGKQLDSLCDVVSFGVAPGIILFYIMKDSLALNSDIIISKLSCLQILLLLSMAAVPAFSALRLAKFNIDTRQTDSFIGVPVPASALLISSLGAMYNIYNIAWLNNLLNQPIILLVISLCISYLLISPLPLFALKFKNFKWKDNKIRFIFIATALLSVFLFKIGGIVLSIIFYILFSLITRLTNK